MTTSAGALDRIQLTGLRVFAHHGVLDFERENGQEFVIGHEDEVLSVAGVRTTPAGVH